MAESEIQNQNNDNFDLQEIIYKYLTHLHWIILSILIFLAFAYIYIRYTPKVYQTASIIKIVDNKNAGFKLPTDNIAFFGSSRINLQNEMEVMKSSILIEKVVAEFDLETLYYRTGKFTTYDLGIDSPFQLLWLGDQVSLYDFSTQLVVNISQNGFTLNQSKTPLLYGSVCYYQNQPFKLILKEKWNETEGLAGSYAVIKLTREQAIKRVQGSIMVSPVSKDSELLSITVTSQNAEWAKTISNAIAAAFNQDGMNDRKAVHTKTIDFVNDRFTFLFKELDSIEKNKAEYKRNEKISTLGSDAGALLATKTGTDNALNKAKIQLYLSEIFIESLNKTKTIDLLPANLGIDKIEVAGLVNQYNELVLKQQKMLLSTGENHPTIIDLRGTQLKLIDNIKVSLSLYKRVLQSEINAISQTSSGENTKYAALPFQEKAIRSIDRQQEIKEMLYILLLQKREEAAINLAIINPSIKIIDLARVNNSPISPKINTVYLGAFALGLLFPIGILYLIFLFDTKLYSKKDIVNILPDIPILVEIPSIENLQTKIVSNDRSQLSEAFRLLRSNLNFLIKDRHSPQVIFITSSIKGEGKTFVSGNLAFSLAALNKRVVLLGADLRNPQLHTLFKTKRNLKGLSNYLIDLATEAQILTSGNEFGVNFDIIFSGPIPPNPAELLSNNRLPALLESLKQNYDYIIVDTAPCLLVTDTISIINQADILLYLVRANYTDLSLLSYIKEIKSMHNLSNLGLILNNVGEKKGYGYQYKYSYNYNYSYGYSDETPSKGRFWKRWLRKLRLKRRN